MNNDLESILKESDLQDVFSKMAQLSEESTTSVNEDVWSVIDLLENILLTAQYDFSNLNHFYVITGVHREM